LDRHGGLVGISTFAAPHRVIELQFFDVERLERVEVHCRLKWVRGQLRPLSEQHCELIRHHSIRGKVVQSRFAASIREVVTYRAEYVAEEGSVALGFHRDRAEAFLGCVDEFLKVLYCLELAQGCTVVFELEEMRDMTSVRTGSAVINLRARCHCQ
jgi:hypothetical protein